MKILKSFLLITIGVISMQSFATTPDNSSVRDKTQNAAKEKPKDQNQTAKQNPKLTADVKQPPPASAAGESQDKNTIIVGVKGMVCAFCASGIEKSFHAQPEVDSVVVSLEKKFLKLTFKPGKTLSNEKISTILKDAGYEANFGS